MEVRENSAGRLYDLLSQARSISGNKPVRHIWSELFGFDSNDIEQVFIIVADMINLVQAAKEDVSKLHGVNHELYLKPFGRVEGLLKIVNLDIPWDSIKGTLDEATMYGLQICSDALGRQRGTLKVDEDRIAEIQKDIEGLSGRVIALDIPGNIKQLIILNLDNIRKAIITYRIKGVDGLQAEIERAIGSIYLHQDEIKNVQEQPNVKDVIATYFGTLEKINQLIMFAKNITEVALPYIPYIKQLLDRSVIS